MKVAVVFGTRPETVKMAPIIVELRRKKIDHVIIVTAQHRDMLDQKLQVFNIEPDYDLNIMQEDQDLFYVTTSVIHEIKPILLKEQPDIILVQGDTTTTFAVSLAAFYLRIPIGHVEAGLRTWDMYNPFPEELNRQLTSRLATLHFAPTSWSKENLLKEGISDESIYVTGNTVIDALLMIVDPDYVFKEHPLSTIDFKNRKVLLLTAHRRENFGKPMEDVFRACCEIVRRHHSVELVYPVHPNPNVRQLAVEIFTGKERIHLIDPLEYRLFIQLMNKSYMILSDSGGIQEEAPSLGKPVLVLRETTERPEAIEAGTAKLVGTNPATILEETERLLLDSSKYRSMTTITNPYGDGKASQRIVEIVKRLYERK